MEVMKCTWPWITDENRCQYAKNNNRKCMRRHSTQGEQKKYNSLTTYGTGAARARSASRDRKRDSSCSLVDNYAHVEPLVRSIRIIDPKKNPDGSENFLKHDCRPKILGCDLRRSWNCWDYDQGSDRILPSLKVVWNPEQAVKRRHYALAAPTKKTSLTELKGKRWTRKSLNYQGVCGTESTRSNPVWQGRCSPQLLDKPMTF